MLVVKPKITFAFDLRQKYSNICDIYEHDLINNLLPNIPESIYTLTPRMFCALRKADLIEKAQELQIPDIFVFSCYELDIKKHFVQFHIIKMSSDWTFAKNKYIPYSFSDNLLKQLSKVALINTPIYSIFDQFDAGAIDSWLADVYDKHIPNHSITFATFEQQMYQIIKKDPDFDGAISETHLMDHKYLYNKWRRKYDNVER